MAEGVVTLFLRKVCDLIEKEAHLLFGVTDHVRLLREKLQWLCLSLKEADNKCPEDEEIKLWVTQVRAATFEAEDVIDKFILKVDQNPINQWITLYKTGKEIEKINSTLDNISDNRSKFGLINVQDRGEPSTSIRKEKRAPEVEEVNVVGIEDEAKMISKMLIEGDDRTSVVSIVGMGGLASFPTDNNGSRVMLTTRKRDVALHANPTGKPHELRLLTNEECWVLLRKEAFLEVANHRDLAKLEVVGKDIARRCRGLPLAVVVLGGLLSRKEQSVHEWEKVLKGISWHLKEGEDQILHILALSYNDLPSYLKMCFLHFSAFPENSNISATKLFQMWIAEGFVLGRGDETMEDVAEDYLLELIHRSLIQVAERSSSGRVKKCRIHDMLRDLAIKKAREDQFLEVYSGNIHSASPTTARRLSITHHDFCGHISLNHSASHLRSMFCFAKYKERLEKEDWKSFYGRLKLLRVMHIDSVPISMVPDGIGNLICLRYLSMSFREGMRMKMLPYTIGNLYNLQTLIILGGHIDILLPAHHGIWKMRQLRHLYIPSGCSPKSEHVKLNELTNLQSISLMKVDHWIMGDFSMVTSLRSLGLLGKLGTYQTAVSNFIGRQKNLESLRLIETGNDQLSILIISSCLHQLDKLHWSGQLKKLPAIQDVALCLTKLVLKRSRLSEDPMAVLEKLPKLQHLKLLNGSYLGKKICSSAEGFPVLAVLEISWCEELEDWTVEEGAIANLRRLKIRKCSKLKMIPEGFRLLTNLEQLVLSWQPPNFLERVEENGLDWFKIRHIPSLVRHDH
ncbi:hypothetical protein AAC387_Pa07g1474 [Persea americana]